MIYVCANGAILIAQIVMLDCTVCNVLYFWRFFMLLVELTIAQNQLG